MALRWARAIAASLVLIVLFSVANNWWGDYRRAAGARAKASTVATDSPSPDKEGSGASDDQSKAAEPQESAVVLTVQIDGLNLRKKASKDADVVRGLDKGEKLTVLDEQDDWYRVKTSKGETGWITADASYTKKSAK